jgi:DNA-binding NtrC family response regulator
MVYRTAMTCREIGELIRDRKFSEALEQLNSIDESTLPQEELGDYYLLQSEASLHVGDYSHVPIEEAIRVSRHTSEINRLSLAKFLRGWWLTVQGRHIEAKEALTEAYAGFLRAGDRSGAARTLNRLSFALFQLGDIGSAIENLRKCALIYGAMVRHKNRVSVLLNLNWLLVISGRLNESVSGYTRISSEISELGERDSFIFFEMSAIPYALKGEFGIARRSLAKAEPYLDTYPRERAIYFENLGRVELLAGCYSAAAKAFRSGLQAAQEVAIDPSLVIQIKRLLGDLHLITRSWDEAEASAKEALEGAERIGERIEIAACYRIFAQLAMSRGQKTEAKEWFADATALFGRMGANYELAVTRFLAGVSGLYDSEQQLTLLQMALDYFEREGVKPYLEQTRRAIRALIQPRGARSADLKANLHVIGDSPAMKRALVLCGQAAPTSTSVLLTGQTGTGKDLLARHIHSLSGRRGEFVSVNAAAVPDTMVESELFGYKRGSFTGSDKDRAGLFEQANEGTFYLNEVADSSPVFQAKLLEVLETHQVRRLGENQTRPASFRLIAATNHDLKRRIAEGKFRLDLFHRLSEIRVQLPPLSDRIEDIPSLVRHFLQNASINYLGNRTEESIERLGLLLSMPSWDGNVRELKNRTEELVHLSGGLISRMIDILLSNGTLTEREWLIRTLERTGWNKRRAAEWLGISRMTVHRRMHRYQIPLRPGR